MVEKGLSFIEAANYVRKRRPIIFPNLGFQRQLVELEKILKQFNDTESVMSKISSKTKIQRRKRNENKSAKNTLRNSIRAQSDNKIASGNKNALTYKEKAKHYYLGLQNNWMDEKGQLQKEYKTEQIERKSATAENPLHIKIGPSTVKREKAMFNAKFSQPDIDGISVKTVSHYKRLNRKYYKTKIREESPNDYKQNTINSKKNNTDQIYQEVKSYYDHSKKKPKHKSKSLLRKDDSHMRTIKVVKYNDFYH